MWPYDGWMKELSLVRPRMIPLFKSTKWYIRIVESINISKETSLSHSECRFGAQKFECAYVYFGTGDEIWKYHYIT